MAAGGGGNDLAAYTPFILTAFALVNALLGHLYNGLREQMKEQKAELKEHKDKFDAFKDKELKAINDKLDGLKSDLTEALHSLHLSLATGYATKVEVHQLASMITKPPTGNIAPPPGP
jgi:hypothetical protein